MFKTDKLIYLQMQKTGCTHIANLLSECVGGEQKIKHQCLQNYHTGKYIIGSVRNPWEWYVSLWAFGCGGRGTLRNRLIGHKLSEIMRAFVSGHLSHIKNEFEKPVHLWRWAYQDYQNRDNFQTWLKLLHDPQRRIDLNEGYPEHGISKFAGFMTYRYCRLYQKDFFLKKSQTGLQHYDDLQAFDEKNNLLDFIIRNESLEDDVVHVLKKAGYNLDENKIKFIHDSSGSKTFKSEHYDSSYYYDTETIDIVANREKFIIEKYDYKPPG